MRDIHVLLAEFREALIRGYIPPLEMAKLLNDMNWSLTKNFPDIHTGLSDNLDDVSDNLWTAIQNFGSHDE
jgi:hypothetical protein